MKQFASITSQGQLTIPKKLRAQFGIDGPTKVSISSEKGRIVVEPIADFWTLAGTMKSRTTLSDEQLRQARASFEKKWARRV
jgi:AbrB family looped-hinge helix DNA binding protein